MAGNSITVDFNANVARFTSGIDKVTNDLSKFQSNADRVSKNINNVLGNIGVGLSAAGVVAFGKSVIDGLDKLNGLSKTTGIAANQLAGLGYAAKQSNSDLESVAASVAKLSVNIGKDGEKFRALGITAKDPIEAFKQLADVFVAIKDPQERAAVASAALGKSWQEAAPLLAEGGAAIGRMVGEGEKASGVTQEMTEAANRFNGQLDAMKAKFAGVSVSIVGDFLPAMNGVLDKLRIASQSGGVFGFFTASNEEEANAQKTIDGLKQKVQSLQKLREELTAPTLANKFNNSLLGSLLSGGVSDVKTLDNQIFAIQKKISYLQGLVKSANEVTEGAKPVKAPSAKAIQDFLGNTSEADKAAKALAERQKNFIESLQKEAATLGMTSAELKVYEAQLLKISGAKLEGVRADAQRIETFKFEQDAAEKSRDAYAEAADSYLKFINATASDNKAAADKLDRLKVELGLLDKTEAERKSLLASYDLEIKFKERLKELDGLDTGEAVRQIQIANLEKEKAAQAEVIRFEEQLDMQKQKAAEMQKVWDNFGFNIQRNLGDQLFNILDGNFKNIGTAWKSMLLRMVSDAAAAQVSKALFSTDMLKSGLSILGSIFGSFSGASGAGSQLRVTAPGSIGYAANGAFFDGNVAKFALGGIVNTPTAFQFASGGAFHKGLMGEAGPEAIMPLKRDSQGRLGVSGGRGVSVNYAPVIQIDSRTDRAEVHAIVSRAVKQGNADLVDKLQRQGAI
jgi:phage-related minor tail protein